MTPQQEALNTDFEMMAPWAQAKLCKMAGDLRRTWPAEKRIAKNGTALLALVKCTGQSNVAGRVLDRQVEQLSIVRPGKSVDR